MNFPIGKLFKKEDIDCTEEERIISPYRVMLLEKQRMLQIYVNMLL